MTPERWRRVRAIFAEAIDLDADERRVLLDAACPDDDELRREVDGLLTAADASEGFLDQVEATAVDRGEGQRLGAYRLVRRIGQGGMGTVYLATRDDQSFERRVAVKLMAHHLADEAMVRRFRTERQILAALDHPHIAKLLDGGTTPEGLPYLVMEYVEGQPIDRYCTDRGLSIDERLRLVLDLCSAIAFAHRNLVVHRDLKPANILVDAEGRLKLLDFGIAKLLNPELAGREVAPTVASLMALTPEYASPEQLTGEPVSTASDVYSLGVVLHQVVAGGLPYRLTHHTPAEVLKAICDDPPRRASETAAEVDEPGGARRRRGLRGDLDNILRVALAKSPHRRYPSVERLADDLRRHLDGQPVSARPATWRYRIGKFVGRHPWGFTATVVLIAASLWFTVTTARQKVEVERQRDRAEQAKELLIDLFQSTDPLDAENEPTLRDVLDLGTERLRDDLIGQPAVRSELLGVLGVVYLHLGDADTAAQVVEEALRAPSIETIDDGALVASLRNTLAESRIQAGRYAEAVDLHRQTLAMRDDGEGAGEDIAMATTLDGLGVALHHLGDLDGAEAAYRRALDRRRDLLGPRHVDTLTTTSNLANLLASRRHFEEAETLHREVLDTRRRTLGAEHVEVAQSLHDLGVVLGRQQRLDAARDALEQAVALRRQRLGERHPRLASSLQELAVVLERSGDDEGAIEHLRQAVRVRAAAHGEGHPHVAAALNNLANILRRRGQLDEAVRHLRSAGDIFAEAYGPDHRHTLATRINAARVGQLAGDPQTAEVALRRLMPKLEALPIHHGVAATYLAEALVPRGAVDEAASMARRAIAILAEAEGDTSWRVAAARAVLARCQLTLGDRADAEAENRRALAVLDTASHNAAAHYLALAHQTRDALATSE